MQDRVDALGDAAALARGVHDDQLVTDIEAVVARARDRLGHGTSHTVVAIAGATGSGKSSIVNRLAGSDVSTASVRRPTTSMTHAVVWGNDDASALLDWLEVPRRRAPDPSRVDPALDGLVLLDLPDHDSTAVEHRLEVDRLVELVDVLIWVTDPQKYADEALHAGYIRPLAAHQSTLQFVLNQVDRLDDDGVEVARDLERLLREDGIDDPAVLSVSALTGAGFESLGGLLTETIDAREAVLARIDNDLRDAAGHLGGAGAAESGRALERLDDQLVTELAQAAGSQAIGDVAARHHTRQGSLAMGWPFTRFLRRLARKPLADLPGPGRDGASEPRTDLAIRDYAEARAGTLRAPWPNRVREAAFAERDALVDDLRKTVGRAAVGAGSRPRWWTVIAWLQRALAVVAVVGLVWLVAVAVLGGFFRFDIEPLLPDTPGLEWSPLPTTMLLGGAVLGMLVALLMRPFLAAGAARRGAAARKTVEAAVVDLAGSRVVAPVNLVLDQERSLNALLAIASGEAAA